jgi:hypothetical protein
LAVIDPVRMAAPPDAAVERLQELLGYVEQVIKLDERPALRLSEHRLASGQAFVLHQHELHALPGVTHDITDEDGAIWLEIQRLKRGEPPEPPDALLPWPELSPDPDRTPKLRDNAAGLDGGAHDIANQQPAGRRWNKIVSDNCAAAFANKW